MTDKIGHLLRRRYSIKTVFRPPTQIKRWLRSPKDKEPLHTPGVYKIPCDCGKCYIGETRRNVSTRLTEHIRSMKKLDSNGSAVAEHAIDSGPSHYIRFDKTVVLAREKFYVPRKIREAIEIQRHPNFNRDGGWLLPHTWKPLLSSSSTARSVNSVDNDDIVSSVCVMLGDSNRSSAPAVTADEQPLRAPPPPPVQPPAPLSQRAQRAAARSAKRGTVA